MRLRIITRMGSMLQLERLLSQESCFKRGHLQRIDNVGRVGRFPSLYAARDSVDICGVVSDILGS